MCIPVHLRCAKRILPHKIVLYCKGTAELRSRCRCRCRIRFVDLFGAGAGAEFSSLHGAGAEMDTLD